MDNPVNLLLKVSLESIKEMVDCNTVIGTPIEITSRITLIPVSKVKCGFMAGGSEIKSDKTTSPFGGGTGGVVSINPIGFIVVNGEDVKLLPLEGENFLEKIIDILPVVKEKVSTLFKDEASSVKS